ncbi:MAG TPA: nucleotidyltransferase domain-containing protein [Longimicrobium sp.]|jgi:predicted nucleotidyltransferase
MSVFFQPLDKLLSSEGKVRILRVLLRAGGPLSGREIARRSRVALLSVQKAMADLVALEAVDRKETTAQHLYSINEANFLVREGIAPLFAAEARRVEAVFGRIRGILSEDEAPEVASASVFGSAARGEDGLASDFDLLVVTRTEAAVWPWQSRLAAASPSLQRELGIRLSPVILSLDDLRRQHGERSPFVTSLLMDARMIVGVEPESLLNGVGGTAQADGPL